MSILPLLQRRVSVLILQVGVWWGANNLYAIDAHILLQKSHRLAFLELTCAQVFVGLCMASAIHFWRSRIRAHIDSRAHPDNHHVPLVSFRPTLIIVIISFLHALGTFFTNASYRSIGSTSTLMWKLSEPLVTVILKGCVLKEPTPMIPLFGLLTAVFGVLLFSSSSLAVASVSPILFANIAFPLRNICVKYDQKDKVQNIPTERRIFRLYFTALPLCFFALLYRWSMTEVNLELLPSLLRNAVLFNLYQFASIAILEKLDAVIHSIANMLKRFTGILLSLIVLGESLDFRRALGLVCTFSGVPLYIIASSSTMASRLSAKSIRKQFFTFICVVCIVTCISSIWSYSNGNGLESGYTLRESSAAKEAPKMPFLSMDIETLTRSDYVIVVAPHFSKRPKKMYNSYRLALQHNEGNVGNFVWQHAAVNKLPDFTSSVTCNDTRKICWKRHSDSPNTRLVNYRPGANAFNDKAPSTFSYDKDCIINHDITPLVIGIGIQEDFVKNVKPDLYPEQNIEVTPTDFEFTEDAKSFLSLMETKKYPIFFRGAFTLEAAKTAGYTHGFSTGCPSLMLNEDVRLGKTLEAKYMALENRIADKTLKVAINIHRQPRFKKFVLNLLEEYPNSLIFAQGKNDLESLQGEGVPFSRVRFYSNVEQWMDGMRKMDVSIGARIHGNMLALGVSVPVFVIAPDHRVLELVERMQIPHVTYFDNFSVDGFDVARTMFEYGFDGDQFDKNRCEIAKIYRTQFSRFGLGVSRHVKVISELC